MGKDLQESQKDLSHDRSEPAGNIELPSAEVDMLSNLYGNERMVETEHACRELLNTYPEALFVINMLGAALIGQGKLEEAVQIYNKAIQLKPDYANAHSNLGVVLYKLQRFEEASKSYQAALSLNPKHADAYTNYGAVLKELGRFEDALESHNKAIQLKPSYASAFINRGLALEKLGRNGEAIKSYNKAIDLEPDSAKAYALRGLLLLDLGLANKSFASIRKAISLDPENNAYWYSFAQCFHEVRFSSYSKKLENYLTRILEHPTVPPRQISKPAFAALRLHPIVSNALELSSRGDIDKNIGQLTSEMSCIPLLLKLMELVPVTELDLEKMLTTLRKAMLCEVINGSGQIQGLPFYSALAVLCFMNDYVFTESNTEINEVQILENMVKDKLEKGATISPFLIAVLASYRPLNSFFWITNILETDSADKIKKVIVQQVINVREEENIRLSIPRLTSIGTDSAEVKSQYEENPYPRWSRAGLNSAPGTLRKVLIDNNVHLNINDHPISGKLNILVAGCGTGQHAVRVASTYLNSDVLAVDLSLTSLSYAKRKTQELGFTNIEYMQADILKLKELEREFDLIECAGVLHHLKEPLTGWRILTDRLCKGGVMHIGLYSEIARQYVVQARQLIKERGLTSSPADIRRFREILIELSEDSQLEASKALGRNDFYSLSECRDLLFHVLEHRFTLPQIKNALKELDLQFLGFSPTTSLSWALKKFPELYSEREAILSLSLWHKFELKYPDTFHGMYQFWVQK